MTQTKRLPLLHLVFGFIYASPFIFPLYLVRCQFLGIPFTFLELFTYLLFAFYVLLIVGGSLTVQWGKPARWYYYSVFILFLGATLGVLTAPHYIALPSGELVDAQRVSLGIWKGWIVAPMLYFFVVSQVIRKESELKTLLLNFVYSGALVSLASYGFGMFDKGVTYDFRLAGFFESANYLSLFLVPALLMGIYYMLHSKLLNRKQELFNLASVTIMVHALFMTQSYAAIIGVFGAITLYIFTLLLKQKRAMRKIFMALVVLLIVFVAIVGSQYNSRKFQHFIDFENRSSSSVRMEIYEISWGLLNDYPLTGVGPGLFQGYYQTRGPGYLEKAPMEWNIPHPHNVFFAFWLNAGLLGFLAFLGMLVLAHRKFTYPLFALWGVLIHGLFDTPFWKNDLAMIYFLILAAILILQSYETHSPQVKKAPLRKRATVVRSRSLKAKKLKTEK